MLPNVLHNRTKALWAFPVVKTILKTLFHNLRPMNALKCGVLALLLVAHDSRCSAALCTQSHKRKEKN